MTKEVHIFETYLVYVFSSIEDYFQFLSSQKYVYLIMMILP